MHTCIWVNDSKVTWRYPKSKGSFNKGLLEKFPYFRWVFFPSYPQPSYLQWRGTLETQRKTWLKNGWYFRIAFNTRRWFQIFFIFTPTWGTCPIWLIFFRWVVQPPTRISYHILTSKNIPRKGRNCQTLVKLPLSRWGFSVVLYDLE